MAEPAPDLCLNCAQPLGAARPRFCPHCGQETNVRPPTVLEFAQQFGGAVISTEGALWRTVKLLVLRPGELTRQYLAGRRRHYVLPIRLYLTTSVVALALLRFTAPSSDTMLIQFNVSGDKPSATVVGPGDSAPPADPGAKKQVDGTADAGTADAGTQATDEDADAKELAEAFTCEGLPEWFCERLKRRQTTDPEQLRRLSKEIRERLVANVGTLMFVLLPSFALLTKLAWFNRGLRYTEHLVFALHLHAFWFLLLPLTLFGQPWTGLVVLFWSAGYTLRALSRVFGGRAVLLWIRAPLVAMVYLTVLGFALMGLSMYILLS